MSIQEVENYSRRVRDELERLGLSLAEASRRSGEKSGQRLKDVVAGKQRCPIDLLTALHGLGVDVAYIVAGSHAVNVVNEEEAKLLEAFRRTPQVVRQAVMAALQVGAVSAPATLIAEPMEQLSTGKGFTPEERKTLEEKAGIRLSSEVGAARKGRPSRGN